MNELAIFNNPEFGELRTVEIDGEPWFVGKDVAVALGYEQPRDAVYRLVDAEDKGVGEIPTPSGKQKMTIINESGLYSLVLSSKLPTAKKFKRWVTSEVLPSIRQNGAYSLNMSRELRAVIVVDQRVTKVQEETNALRQDFEVFKQDMPILGVEETKITEAVKRKGVECLGGKESPAYRNKGLRSRVYQDIYRELKRQFGVTTYKAIKRNQTNEAVKVIDSYHLPLVLKNQVDALNAQTGMWKVIG
mgnify:CR=1 FL=1